MRGIALLCLAMWLFACERKRQHPPPPPTTAAQTPASNPQPRRPKAPRPNAARRKKPPARRHAPNIRQVGAAKEFRHLELLHLVTTATHAYACTAIQGFQIYDITTPTRPKERGEYRFPLPYGGYNKPGCRYVALDGQRAFVSNAINAYQPLPFVAALDISRPQSPKALAYFSPKGIDLAQLVARKGRVYVAAHQKGLLVLQLEPKASASRPTTRPTAARPTAARPTVARPTSRPVVAQPTVARPTSRPVVARPVVARPTSRRSAPSGRAAARRSSRSDKMQALQRDLRRTSRLALGTRASTKTSHKLRQVARLQGFQNAQGIAFSGAGFLLVADGPGGLKLVEITPAGLRLRRSLKTRGYARRVAVYKGYAYVSEGNSGFEIFDVREPLTARVVAHVPTEYSVVQIALQRGFAFVANWNDLRIYDIQDPAKPRWVAARALEKRKDTYRLPYEKSLTQIRNASIAVRYPYLILGEWLGLRVLRFEPRQVPILQTHRALHFPATAPGKRSTLALPLSNAGQATLRIRVELVGSKVFWLAHKAGPIDLGPGQRSTLTLGFAPRRKGLFRARLKLQSNDPHRPSLSLPIEASGGPARPGAAHRDFQLRDLHGESHSLSQLRGKVVLLSYFATF